jgi:ATP-dependent helicase HrpB
LPGIPNGAAIAYEQDRPPWIAARIQDFFGMSDGPKLANGKVPLVLHILAPNDRPIQVTSDLAGFWDRHYPTLKKELARRYPKHFFPDDPRTAPAKRLVRRVKEG